ncbi:MAG: hypothetical protein ACKOD2_13665 [Ilumatobacteraceae bacterium]
MKTKKMAVIGVTAGLLAGAGAGLLLNLPGGASASGSVVAVDGTSDDSTNSDAPATSIDGSADGEMGGQHHGGRHGSPEQREARLRELLQTLVDDGTLEASDIDAIVTAMQTEPADEPTDGTPADRMRSHLQSLVDDGTLTSAQVDAVIAALEAARPGDGPGHGGPGHGGPGHGGRFGGEILDTAATAIGITADELKTALQGGQTIAQVAAANGVDVQDVIDALVAEATANIEQRITDMVNGVRPEAPADATGTSAA